MKADVKLYISGYEVEFSKDPQILFNYKLTDITNPTATKNSFSKSITIEGTNQNNEIFGQIWNLERIQTAGSFNPIKKTDFVIYLNGDIYEKGYCKLESVTTKNNTLQYSIALFGGLGSFFQHLTYGDNEETNTKMTLADLRYTTRDEAEPDLNFRINKDAIKEAWDIAAVEQWDPSSKWNTINFAPCYNGIPTDFSADKVLINNKDLTAFTKTKTEDGVTYTIQNGYSLGESREELTADETFDYRSYLQRPVLRVRRAIEACCQPENNGGWEVDLDDHFFNNNNPYWDKAWMTLKNLKELDIQPTASTAISGAYLRQNTSYRRFQDVVMPTAPTISDYINLKMKFRMRFRPTTSTSASVLYTYSHFNADNTVTLQNRFVEDFYGSTGIMVQMLGMDAANNIVAQSKAYFLGTTTNNLMNDEYLYNLFYNESDSPEVRPSKIESITGNWYKQSNGTYAFYPYNASTEFGISFEFLKETKVSKVVLKIKYPYIECFDMTNKSKKKSLKEDTLRYDNYSGPQIMYTSYRNNVKGNYEKNYARNYNRVTGNYEFYIDSFSAEAADVEALFSDTEITKDKLLSTSFTPCDFLLSYAKLFGLYFYIDPNEESEYDDCPKGVIHICDRHTYYHRDKVVNLEELIDTAKNVKVVQQVPAARWYEFKVDEIDSDANNEYKSTYGFDYGRHLVNTGYNFDSNTKQLYDGNVFKAGVMVREVDKYFNKPSTSTSKIGERAYVQNGFTYHLFHRNGDEFETVDIDYPVSTITNSPINNLGKKRLDSYSKLQCHTEDNEASDGSNVLLFLDGSVTTPMDYYITDDVTEMNTLNDGEACWLLTNSEFNQAGQRIAYKRRVIPFFSRHTQRVTDSSTIVHSWDFGHPMVSYCEATNTENMGIYDKCWRKFVNDVYSENSRTISCYVNLEGKPSIEMMRQFYWFQNALWRINEIKDWNVGSFDTTQCEFIKVQDINNYDVDEIAKGGRFYAVPSQSSVGYNGGPITISIFKEDGGCWFLDESGVLYATDGVNQYDWELEDIVSQMSGCGLRTDVTLNVPFNPSNKYLTYSMSIIDDDDIWTHCSWAQEPQASYIKVDRQLVELDYDAPMAATIKITSNVDNYNITIKDKI